MKIKSVLAFLLIGAIISYCLESCKTKVLAMPREANTISILALNIPRNTDHTAKPKDTTVKIELTDRQRLFYDKYFVPQFESLKMVISAQSRSLSSQAQSIAGLTETLQQMRVRAIKRTDSMNMLQRNDKLEYAKLEKIYLDQQRKQVVKNANQIDDLKSITDVLVVFGILLMLGFAVVCILVWVLWKKIEKLSKKLSDDQ